MSGDRTVHAVSIGGSAVVRYERAGKWYLEHTDGSRAQLTVAEAAKQAARPGYTVYLDKPGGQSFDAKVRKLRAGLS